jgi:DNA-binding transcriptional ArsR family regulator
MEKSPDLLPIETLQEAAECLKALGHPSRLRMVEILMQGEYAVHEIARLCQLPPHQACEHLRMLKGHGLLKSNRRGRSVYYQIADPRLPRLVQCIRAACEQSTRPVALLNPSTPDHPQDP